MPGIIEKELCVRGNRGAIRKQVVRAFLREKSGTGRGELVSRYRYNVEMLRGGERVFLARPAALNKGFDFTVHLEGWEFRPRHPKDMPRHADILEGLHTMKGVTPRIYSKIVQPLIVRIFNCDAVQVSEMPRHKLPCGLSVESLLLCMKWLFIEQDITYWNWSGRHMLFDKLFVDGLV